MQTDSFGSMRAGPSSYPRLEWAEFAVGFARPAPVQRAQPVQLRLGRPVPRAPVMVDYHSLPEPMVSERLDVLEPLNLFGLQLVPADVKVKADDVRRYWLLHVYNELVCIERQHSAPAFSRRGMVLGIDRLVLDEAVLREVPLEWRQRPPSCSTTPWWSGCWRSGRRGCASSGPTGGTTRPASIPDGAPRSKYGQVGSVSLETPANTNTHTHSPGFQEHGVKGHALVSLPAEKPTAGA